MVETRSNFLKKAFYFDFSNITQIAVYFFICARIFSSYSKDYDENEGNQKAKFTRIMQFFFPSFSQTKKMFRLSKNATKTIKALNKLLL